VAVHGTAMALVATNNSSGAAKIFFLTFMVLASPVLSAG